MSTPLTPTLILVRQPNALFAVFDVNAGRFAQFNLDAKHAQRALSVLADDEEGAVEMARAIVDESFDAPDEPTNGQHRWRVCVATTRALHGINAARAARRHGEERT